MRQPFLQIGLLVFLILTPLFAFGGTIKSFSTSEDYYRVVRGEGNSIKIYAGNTYADCLTTSEYSTCDSCAFWVAPSSDPSCDLNNISGCASAPPGNAGLACNRQQVNPGSYFVVNVETSEDLPCASTPLTATYGTSDSVTSTSEKTGSRSATLKMKWSAICEKLSGDSDCKTSFPHKEILVSVSNSSCSATSTDVVKVQIGLRYVAGSVPVTFGCTGTDAYEGFCHFTVYPGDQKVYITDARASSSSSVADLSTGTPNGQDSSGFKQAAVRVYYREGSSFSGITLASSSVDLSLDSDGNLSEDKITGLKNGVSYTFILANVDEGGNVTNHTDPAASPSMSATPGFKTTQGATPEKVYGLLDGKNCFIATAAYGSGEASDVELLRKFRNQYLLSWSGGQSFVRFYYQVSPPIANFIAEHESLKLIVRTVLKPFVLLAELMLWGGLAALFALITLSALLLAIIFSPPIMQKSQTGQVS